MSTLVSIKLKGLFAVLERGPKDPDYPQCLAEIQRRYQHSECPNEREAIRKFDKEVLIPQHGRTKLPPGSVHVQGADVVHQQLKVLADNAPKEGYLWHWKRRWFPRKTDWAMISGIATLAGLIIACLIYFLGS